MNENVKKLKHLFKLLKEFRCCANTTKMALLPVYIIAVFITLSAVANGQDKPCKDSSRHVLTVYMLKSLKPLHWESPASLVKSTIKGYKAKLLHHRQYLLGHMIARLESPLVGGTKYSAMVSTSMKEKRVLMLKEKIGLGILGVPMGGKLDSDEDIHKDLKMFSRLEKIAYVKYFISEESARKIILFMDGFSQSEEGEQPPCSHYGGAFWPLYQNEGAGCTAYAMAMIDAAGLLGMEHDDWKVDVNIPLDLVGGELNQGRKVSTKELRKSNEWASNDTVSEQACIPFTIFDPTFAFRWIKNQREETGPRQYVKDEENGLPGVVADMRHIKPDTGAPVFIKRPNTSPFIEYFERKKGSLVGHF